MTKKSNKEDITITKQILSKSAKAMDWLSERELKMLPIPTPADRLIVEVQSNLKKALVDLGKVVLEQEYGYQEYTDDYKVCLSNALYKLMEVRDILLKKEKIRQYRTGLY